MVVDELLPRARRHGVTTDRIGLLGWSMGGYGALRLGGPTSARSGSAAVVAVSPALWTRPRRRATRRVRRRGGVRAVLRSSAEQDDLAGIPVRVDCGTGDPFYRDGRGVRRRLPRRRRPHQHVRAGRATTAAYWRRMLPAELEFLGRRVASGGVSDLEFRSVGLGADAVDYLAAWDLQREVHARGRRRRAAPTPCCCSSTRRSSPPASAPSRTSGRSTRRRAGHRRRPRRQDHLPRPRPAGRLPDRPAARPRQGRRLRPPGRGGADPGLRRLRRHHRPGARPQRRLAARRRPRPRAQGRRDRHPGQPRRDHARLRPQLRRRPRAGTTGSSPAASPTPASPR